MGLEFRRSPPRSGRRRGVHRSRPEGRVALATRWHIARADRAQCGGGTACGTGIRTAGRRGSGCRRSGSFSGARARRADRDRARTRSALCTGAAARGRARPPAAISTIFPQVHHGDPVARCGGRREVVRDEEVGEAEPRPAGRGAGSGSAPAPRRRAREIGSSQTISDGFDASARAIATRWRWPPESWCGYRAREVRRQADEPEELADASCAGRGLLAAQWTGAAPRRSSPTVILGSSDGARILEDHLDAAARSLASAAARVASSRPAVERNDAAVFGVRPHRRAAADGRLARSPTRRRARASRRGGSRTRRRRRRAGSRARRTRSRRGPGSASRGRRPSRAAPRRVGGQRGSGPRRRVPSQPARAPSAS